MPSERFRNGHSDARSLESEVAYRRELQEICNRIYAASDIDEILVGLKDNIASLVGARRITIYVVDGQRKQLVSRYKTGDEISEIRLDIAHTSLAGYSARNQKLLNIANAYDKAELTAIDKTLEFDDIWDRKTGFLTRQVLVNPIIHKNYLLGAVQVLNRVDGQAFRSVDERSIEELSRILGIALYSQKRIAARRAGKFDYLVENELLTRKELDTAITTARGKGVLVEELLLEGYKIAKKDVLQALSRHYSVPFVEFSPAASIPGELLKGLKVPFMRRNYWVPIAVNQGRVAVAVDQPSDLNKVDEIRSLFKGRDLELCVALRRDIRSFIDLFTSQRKIPAAIDEIIGQLRDEIEEIEENDSVVVDEDSTVVQLVHKIILDADSRKASDIHIEPSSGKKETRVRFRIDGSCIPYQTIPYPYRNAVVSRIKIMADLDIAERRKPQDGKIKFKKFGGKDIELRVATVPTQGGVEDVVLRILRAGRPVPLEQMLFSELNYTRYHDTITRPYGLILVCGPTGSGKTTTLHSTLAQLNNPGTKIWTAEDPVEITQEGLRQVQVNPKIGFGFSAAMRAFLRADPDVIMVGEMRDQETARIAIEASLTGHLVLSTLHTNSAPDSIVRLLDMGMDPFHFADAILCILAQRLVLTLCTRCKRAYHPSKDTYEELVRAYGGTSEFAARLDIPYGPDLTLYRPVGCEACNQTGYLGRIALHELLTGTKAVKRMIQSRAPVEAIRAQAVKEGMATLKQDGIAKLFGGHTDLLQVRKVTIK